MFCLVADVRIREQTHNQKGLQDALRAIHDHGGIITEDWEIERALQIGDDATGTKVLIDLYHELRDKPDPIDLDAMWKKLGITVDGKTVKFDPTAPDAKIREAITHSAK
jgi:predicted metalloprotease with PDZ domain